MIEILKNHPFAVEAFFKKSIVLTFALPKAKLQNLIPECLTLDLYQDETAFIAVAMVQTTQLRPKGFPRFIGREFFLIGYRVFVRYTTIEGKKLRGLYILKSETDSRLMQFMGNIFTHYNYTTSSLTQFESNEVLKFESAKSGFKVEIDKTTSNIELPAQSPFMNWKEARRFAGPLPFTFTFNKVKKEVLIIEGVREDWNPISIKINAFEFSYLNHLFNDPPILANAFIIENIPYYWKKGILEKWIK